MLQIDIYIIQMIGPIYLRTWFDTQNSGKTLHYLFRERDFSPNILPYYIS